LWAFGNSYVHHDRGQIDDREVADILKVVYVEDLLTNILLGPALGSGIVLNDSYRDNEDGQNEMQDTMSLRAIGELTWLLQRQLLSPPWALMLMQVPDGMSEFVQDDTSVVVINIWLCTNPPEVHGILSLRDAQVIFSDIRPRTVLGIERDTNDRVPIVVSEELELEVGVLLPFFDDLFNFILLGLRSGRADERDGQSLW
jgi:hypothetical protein